MTGYALSVFFDNLQNKSAILQTPLSYLIVFLSR